MVAIFNPKARKFIQGRKHAWQELTNQLASNTHPILWVHCSSVGEYEQGRPVIEAFKKKYTDYKVLVTFFSPSGYEAIATDEVIDFKSYLPFDSRKNSKRFIRLVAPGIVFFVKYEFWYYYLKQLKEAAIPTYSISSIFRSQQVFFKCYGGFYRQMLNNFNYFFVQDELSHRLLDNLNLPNKITGDTRLDRVIALKNQRQEIPQIEAFCAHKEVMVVGSIRKEDVELIIDFIKLHPDLKYIIAPHEIIESMMRPLENELKSTIRYSALGNSDQAHHVLIIDNIGMLTQLYGYANYAYVGGGFSDGLHNILEPAVFGVPVFFGNRAYQTFKEAIDLIDLGAGFPVGNIKEFDTVFSHLQGDKSQQSAIERSISGYLETNQGASEKIISHISKNMP